MLTEETKKPLNIRPLALIGCFVFLIGLSAATTYFTVRVKYQSQLDYKNQEVLTVQENNKALADQDIELRNSLRKLQDEYSTLESRYKDIESRLNTAEQKNIQTASDPAADLKEAPVLKPTWVGSYQMTLAFDGSLRIILHKAADKDECPKDSATVGYLTSDTDKMKLCLRTGKPENFTYQGKGYLFTLSGIAAQAEVYRYCISISEESAAVAP